MRIVVALGGNALLKRGEPMNADNQRENIRSAAEALAPLAEENELILSHGNGPQVGLLALQATSFKGSEPYPLDILGAETEGMIGYMIEQEMRNHLPPEKPLATILTMVEIDPEDPAFGNPEKFVGPLYSDEEADIVAEKHGWIFGKDSDRWRRVVPSPRPVRIFEIEPIRWLIEKGAVVICTGGGGIPVQAAKDGSYEGVEAVIDKDLASAMLAKDLSADLFIMATDVEGVYLNRGRSNERLIQRTTPDSLCRYEFPAGSMGPKVDAACRFVRETGNTAAIGSLGDITRIAAGDAGTIVVPDTGEEQ